MASPPRSPTPWIVGILLVAAVTYGFLSRRPPEPSSVTSSGQTLRTLRDGVLTVGTDLPYPPFEYRNADRVTGFDVDLIYEVAERLGLRPRIVDADYDGILDRLAASEFDVVMAATSITPQDEERVNFSTPYYELDQAMVVDPSRRAGLEGASGLGRGDVVGVIEGSTGETWALERLEPRAVSVLAFPDVPSVYGALGSGELAAVITDEASALAELSVRPELEIVEVIETGQAYGIAVDPANVTLLETVNEALESIIADGTYDDVYDRYAAALPPSGRVTGSPSA